MAKDKEEKKDEDEGAEPLVVVTDRDDDVDVPPTGEQASLEYHADRAREKKTVNGKDESEDEHEEEADEEEEDSRLAASDDTEDEDQKRSSHKSRRQRKKEAELRLKRERDFLERRNEQLERQLASTLKEHDERLSNSEKTQLENRIAQAKGIIQKAEGVIADAITNNKGNEAAEATRIRDQWRDHLKELETVRTSMDEEPEKERKPVPANPAVVAQAQAWHKKNSWYDFAEGDMDSKVVGLIDKQVASEGFDPTSRDYWDEVTKRAKALLPHRFKKKAAAEDEEDIDEDVQDEDEEPKPKPKAGNGKPKPKGGPRFRTGGPGRDLGQNEVHLSRERIAAMKELGVWDDPKLREKYLRKYKEWDDTHGRELN